MALALLTTAISYGKNDLPVAIESLPRTIDPGLQGNGHVQGIVADVDNNAIYYSFTTFLLKTDLQGKPLASVNGLTGHLGCLTFDKKNRKIYGSLEYKNDAIGKGILKYSSKDGQIKQNEDGFYIAIFDIDKIDRMNMDAEKDKVMNAVYLKEVVDDYSGKVNDGTKNIDHVWGCSGIDGVTFAPVPGSKNKDKKYLHVAYGIYGDTTRTDNDYQVILAYDTKNWDKYAKPLSQLAPHKSGPKKHEHKYFVHTGNARYGIQNLAYDPSTDGWLAAVYTGKKSWYPNYSLFMIDGSLPSKKNLIKGTYKPFKGEEIFLKDAGLKDEKSGVRGWYFPYGSTGIAPLGDGYFYISHNYKKKKKQGTTLHLYKWTGNPDNPFEEVR